MMLKRIKYVSRFSSDMSQADIDALVEQASRKNKKLEITGILVASGNLFFQIIEGPAKHIDQLYTSIENDKRHHNVLLLNSEWGVKDRIFPDWSMKKIDLGSESKSRLEPLRMILETIVESRNRVKEMTSTLERAIWEEFLS
jgi:adenylate cyclase